TTIKSPDGTALSGDQAARILDLVGIVVNRNTIPGDKNSLDPSGLRLGTPWITQRGFNETTTRQLTDIMADVLLACAPHAVDTPHKGRQRRAKLDFNVLNDAKLRVRKLAARAGIDFTYKEHGYPHFYYIDDESASGVFKLTGRRARQMLDYAASGDLSALKPGTAQKTTFATPQGIVKGTLTCADADTYFLEVRKKKAGVVAAWLRDLSDGYTSFRLDGEKDFDAARMPGPTLVEDAKKVGKWLASAESAPEGQPKPWFLGMAVGAVGEMPAVPPPFEWVEPPEGEPRFTPLHDTHKSMGAKMVPFAGWDMPVWYTSVVEEHLATRQAAGLFDVSHMGVYEVRGPDAASFLDTICANDVGGLLPGESLYSQFMTPDADVIDDTLVYRRGPDKFLVVVNASNDDKDRTWFESVRDGTVKIDNVHPWARTYGYQAEIRNLRDPQSGEDMRIDIALQGPKSRDILLAMGVDADTRKRIMKLKRTELCDAVAGGFDLIASRTGYTGEKMAFELFVHPERAVDFWNALLKAGEPFGLKPIGLGARDSLRTEAGLPLYGHEMGLGSGKFGERDLGVAEGGFGSYVKPYKPYFIGREAYLAREKERKGVVIRFRFDEPRVRMAHNGDPVMNAAGERIGWVTSCAVDAERYLTGQAYLGLKSAAEGAPILIYQGGVMDRPATPAKVVSRFPKS
ncbi:MAG: glycine cleavage system aminomethyltransferase GcvT, partial [Bacteroidota bacterium]